jgi:hypothetical protein
MIVNKKNPNVEAVYTTKDGEIIYGFKDINEMSPMRGVSALKAKRFASLNLTRDELSRLILKAKVSINTKQDFVEAFAIMQEIEYRNRLICEESTLLDLANIYLMIEGEDMLRPTEEINKKKLKICEENFDVKCFFLQSAVVLMGYFSKKQPKDLLTYLEETQAIAQRIYQYIPKNT